MVLMDYYMPHLNGATACRKYPVEISGGPRHSGFRRCWRGRTPPLGRDRRSLETDRPGQTKGFVERTVPSVRRQSSDLPDLTFVIRLPRRSLGEGGSFVIFFPFIPLALAAAFEKIHQMRMATNSAAGEP
jgi:hypothetical protein